MDSKNQTKEKQMYLRTAIVEEGYEPEKFVDFLTTKREDGADIDTWTMEDLKKMVAEFKKSMTGESLDESTRVARAQTTLSKMDLNDSLSEEEAEEKKQSVADMRLKLHRDATQTERENRTRILDEVDLVAQPSPTSTAGQFKEWLEKEKEVAAQKEREWVDFTFEGEGKDYPVTELSQLANAKAIIISSKLVKGGFFSSSYVSYTIQTRPTEATVERRFSDFYWLRGILVRDCPGVYVSFSVTLDSSNGKQENKIF